VAFRRQRCLPGQQPERLTALADHGLFVVVEPILDLLMQSGELATLLAKPLVGLGELEHGFSFLGSHLAGHHNAFLAPSQAGVRVAFFGFGAPAVCFPAAGIDLIKGPSQHLLTPEDLPQ